ncbi:hypothetical protein [Haladaptatus sp. CMSO5]|uniref:hypothetical protein n=1 Tax=Haladaptatus sp. CMSO5 TaxID=3120514 RepID=UPI002FCE5730
MKFKFNSHTALAVLLAAILLAVPVAGAVVGGVNWSADAAPAPEHHYDVTKSVHKMDWGVTDEDARKYENDEGDVVKMEAQVNQSSDLLNPYSFTATHVNDSDWGAFPHEEENVSALDAGEWSVDNAGATSGSGNAAANVEVASDVDAIRFQTDGAMAGGDTVVYTFNNFSVTSDENKRFMQVGMDIDTLDSGTIVEVAVIDEDGDEKVSEVNTSRSSGEDFIANATGDGYVFQRQLGEMTTVANGDGTFDNIESVEVRVIDGDADVSVSLLNLEKLSKYQLGIEKYENADEDIKTREIYEVKTVGAISVHSLSTLGSWADDAEIRDLTFSAIGTADLTGDEDIMAEFEQTDKYPGYHGTATIYVRMGPADSYDLSYANAEFVEEQQVTEDRIISVELAEGVSEDTELENISDSEWSDKTSLYTGEGTNVTLDSTIQPGSLHVVKYELKLDEEQFMALQQSQSAGGFQEDGGLLAGFMNWIMAGFATIAGSLAVLTKFGKSDDTGA